MTVRYAQRRWAMVGPAGDHDDRGVAIILEAARRIGELTQRVGRQRIVAAVEAPPV